MDIVELILHQHGEQRRQFAALDEIATHATNELAAVWDRLRIFLEVHAEAEERFFYPRLLEVGKGQDSKGDGPDPEVKDAIKDHNEIRDGIAKVATYEVGSPQWWAAVRETRKANSDHMGEEECDDLSDFARHADLSVRHEIAVAFLTFESQHADGVVAHDKDPDAYLASPR